MALVDLKKTQEEARPETEAVSEKRQREEYSYGLRITLDKDALGKLEFPFDRVQINQVIHLSCRAEVIAIRDEPVEPDEKSIELQITHLDFSLPETQSKFKSFHDQQTEGPGGVPGE